MVYERLNPRVKKAWRIGNGIGLVFVLIAYIITRVIMSSAGAPSDATFWVNIGFGVVGLIFLLSLTIFTEIQYRQWGYYIGEDKVEIRKGIFFISTEIIPVVRIQHINSNKGPIDRAFKLATVEISTASGSFKIVGLDEVRVTEISENLKNKLVKRMKEEQK